MRDDEGDVTRDEMEATSRADDQPAAARRPASRKTARESVREPINESAPQSAAFPDTPSLESERPEARYSEDEIRERAYELYRMRGGLDGFDQADWFAAEQEIRSRPPQEPPGRSSGSER